MPADLYRQNFREPQLQTGVIAALSQFREVSTMLMRFLCELFSRQCRCGESRPEPTTRTPSTSSATDEQPNAAHPPRARSREDSEEVPTPS